MRRAACLGLALSVALAFSPMLAGQSSPYGVPTVRRQEQLRLEIARKKIDQVLPAAMRAHGFDMWIVLDRENNPDPLHESIGGAYTYSGVRGAFVFWDRGAAGIEKLFFGSHEQLTTSIVPHLYDVTTYYGYSPEGLTPLIREAVRKRNPKKIGINVSRTLPEADGLTAGLKEFLLDALGPEYASRLASAELLVRDFRTHRIPEETALFTQLVEWTVRWMEEGFATVVPGRTSAADLNWWLEQRARDIGLRTGASGSNVPRVVRAGEQLPLASDDPIQPGDIISLDSGLAYLGYETDLKRTAYVLRPGEAALPASFSEAWRTTLDVSDVYAHQMQPGRIGHEVWNTLSKELERRGYRSAGPDAGGRAVSGTEREVGVYGHSIGNNSHDIGARIAPDVPFAYGERVRFPLVDGEFVSVEFHLTTPIPEWGGKTWYSRFEENAQVGSDGAKWLVPRQEKLRLIKPGADGRPNGVATKE